MKSITNRTFRMKRGQQGFTLMELMVALFLTVFLVGGVLAIYQSGKISFLDSTQLSRIQESVRFASDYMIRDIRNAGFRDETFLRVSHEAQIENGHAQIVVDEAETANPPALRIRYAGRGSCTEAFDEFRLVENEYSVNANGELVCRGRNVSRLASADTYIWEQPWDDAIPLVSGVTGIDFTPTYENGETVEICHDDGDDPLTGTPSTCVGVIVALQFQGLRELEGTQDFEPRSVELTASFRNIVLDRMNDDAWGSEAGEGEEGT